MKLRIKKIVNIFRRSHVKAVVFSVVLILLGVTGGILLIKGVFGNEPNYTKLSSACFGTFHGVVAIYCICIKSKKAIIFTLISILLFLLSLLL